MDIVTYNLIKYLFYCFTLSSLFISGFQFVKRSYPSGTTYEPLPCAIHFHYGIGLAPVFDMEFAFPFNLHDDGSSYQTISQALKYDVEEAERDAKGRKYQCYKF